MCLKSNGYKSKSEIIYFQMRLSYRNFASSFKHYTMKHTALLMILTCTLGLCTTTALANSDEGRKAANLIKRPIGPPSQYIDRSLQSCLEAYIIEATSEIEIVCHDEGQVSACLVDSRNNIYDIVEFDSTLCYSGLLDLPTYSGAYYLIIYTEKTYAEGVIAVD